MSNARRASRALSPDAAGRFARRNFSSAPMSDTKWRKLFEALSESEPKLGRVLVKFIDVDEPREMTFPPGLNCPHAYMDTFEFGPVELRAIEWIDVAADIAPALAPLGRFPIEAVPGGTRIVGYRR